MLFADNSLLFCPATSSKCTHLLNILGSYEQGSGQAINRQKTALSFSPNTEQVVREDIQRMLNAQVVSEFEKYWGLPMVRGQKQNEHLQRSSGENS